MQELLSKLVHASVRKLSSWVVGVLEDNYPSGARVPVGAASASMLEEAGLVKRLLALPGSGGAYQGRG